MQKYTGKHKTTVHEAGDICSAKGVICKNLVIGLVSKYADIREMLNFNWIFAFTIVKILPTILLYFFWFDFFLFIIDPRGQDVANREISIISFVQYCTDGTRVSQNVACSVFVTYVI